MTDRLRELAENVARHMTLTMMEDQSGKPYMEVSMMLNHRIVIARIIEGKESERNTLSVDLALMTQWLRDNPAMVDEPKPVPSPVKADKVLVKPRQRMERNSNEPTGDKVRGRMKMR